MRKRVAATLGVLLLSLAVLAPQASAAETVHLFLKVDGVAVTGESTQQSLGRADSIECVELRQQVSAPDSSLRPTFGPITCVKRIDMSTPALLKALADRSKVEGSFKFYRPNPTGDGTTQQFFTVEIKRARITNYRMVVPSTIDPSFSGQPPMEEIEFTYGQIAWIYTNGNLHFETSATLGTTLREAAPVTATVGYNLKGTVSGNAINLTWSAPTAPTGKTIKGYNVFRSETARSSFTQQERLNDFLVTRADFTESMPAGTYYYYVQAVYTDGTSGDLSAPATVTVS